MDVVSATSILHRRYRCNTHTHIRTHRDIGLNDSLCVIELGYTVGCGSDGHVIALDGHSAYREESDGQ
jgi:hypothetical protein